MRLRVDSGVVVGAARRVLPVIALAAVIAGPASAKGVHFVKRAVLSYRQPMGYDLAISASGGVVVTRANCLNGGGALLVYEKPRTGWRTTGKPAAVLRASGVRGLADLGCSNTLELSNLAISADGSTIVAGESSSDAERGGFLVFVRSGAHWHGGHQSAYIAYPNIFPETAGLGGMEALGGSVAVSGNGSLIVASAADLNYQAPNDVALTGAELVYARPAGGWAAAAHSQQPQASLISPANSRFGTPSLSRDGSILAAAAGNDVLVYARTGAGWTLRGDLIGSGSTTGLGNSLTISASGDEVAAGANGGVYVFERPGAVWSTEHQTALLRLPRGNEQTTSAVALSQRLIVATSDGVVAPSLWRRHGGRWSNDPHPSSIVWGHPIASGPQIAMSANDVLVVSQENVGINALTILTPAG